MMANRDASSVSRETALVKRRRTQGRGNVTRRRLMEAVLAYAETGRYRVSGEELARHAGVHKTAINRHYGAPFRLYRAVARDHWAVVKLPFSAVAMLDFERKAAVWALLVGEPKS